MMREAKVGGGCGETIGWGGCGRQRGSSRGSACGIMCMLEVGES